MYAPSLTSNEEKPTSQSHHQHRRFARIAIIRLHGLLRPATGWHTLLKLPSLGSIGPSSSPPKSNSMTMGDLTQRVLAKLTRRKSTTSSSRSSIASVESKKKRDNKSREGRKPASTFGGRTIDERDEDGQETDVAGKKLEGALGGIAPQSIHHHEHQHQPQPQHQPNTPTTHHTRSLLDVASIDNHRHDSTSTADFPTPNTTNTTDTAPVLDESDEPEQEAAGLQAQAAEIEFSVVSPSPGSTSKRPSELSRRQSLLPHQQTQLIKTLLETELPAPATSTNVAVAAAAADYFALHGPSTISGNMVSRKLWVKRPGQSATLVTIHEDDLVDDVRDMILRKYANSLGRSFDAPDVTLRIVPRENRQDRTLGPEEPMGRTLDAYFPGGQTVDEALVIDVPLRRTPKPSPRTNGGGYYDHDERRPAEAASDYFPPMPAPAVPSPHLPNALPAAPGIHHSPLTTHAMSVLTTGHVPNLPSPGATRRHHSSRPRMGRQHTSSPTVISGQTQVPVQHNGMQAYPLRPHSRSQSNASEKSNTGPPPPPPLPTPPVQPLEVAQIQRVATPPPRKSSPRPQQRKKSKRANEHPSLPTGMLNAAVPPINVLIVEDNIINLKLLEAFMKRLKVRWQTAMDGKQAVAKWKTGGFHLVLMDIQLPVMSGLEATREIRRLERLNSIGVFSSASTVSGGEVDKQEPTGEDKLSSTVLFKSPVIIVALTASSLQSDRHEALAAGCNDFLTKVSSHIPIFIFIL